MKISGGSNLFQFQIKKTNDQLANAFKQLASGKRINSAADDPAGLALANALTAQVNELEANNRNIADTQFSLQTTDGALSETSNNLQRLRELAVQSSNGTLSANDRANLQQEYDQVLQQIDSNTASNTNSSALGVQATGVSTQSSSQDAIEAIDSALAQVNSSRAEVGAEQNALEYRSEANAIQKENLMAARSQTEDADYAEVQSKVVATQFKLQAQIAAAKAQYSVAGDLKKLIG